MNEDDMRLGDTLRREADAVPVGPAPVDEVLRRGRAARRRRTAAGAGAFTVLAVVLALVPLTGRSPHPPPPPPATAPPVTAMPSSIRTVQPYEPVAIGHGIGMALLPDGRQNYVVGPGDLTAAIDDARSYPGDNIRDDSISSGKDIDTEHVLYRGAFRTDRVPSRVEVRLDSGERIAASVLRLHSDPGWGTYYAFGDPARGTEGWTVTAYGADGGVLVEQHFGNAAAP
ncbi:hypothetical protein ACIQ7Q_13120 [Streptomyces sp. NPDC096176]|uniref:hypothetical protein n=1 Tax=Streptomyces sp. NPDC096176 TaxID=3366079 RepID=UPI00382A3C79